MANEYRKITLTELGGNAGPNYSVEYSTDCVTYFPSVDCTNIVLSTVGSHAYCTVDDASTCIRLTSLGALCDNSVIEDFGPTTTTTTLSPTTSTTSTTLSPTTTSTTTAAPITYWSASYCIDNTPVPVCLRFTSSVSIGQVGNFNSLDPDTCFYLTGQYETPCPFYFTINNLYDDCQDCSGYTTTTTASPTTTCPVLYTYAVVHSENNGTTTPNAPVNCCAAVVYNVGSTRNNISLVVAGDVIYSFPCTPFNGGSKYYGFGNVGETETQIILQIDSNGVILQKLLCTPCLLQVLQQRHLHLQLQPYLVLSVSSTRLLTTLKFLEIL